MTHFTITKGFFLNIIHTDTYLDEKSRLFKYVKV